jgi:hypothetical protein
MGQILTHKSVSNVTSRDAARPVSPAFPPPAMDGRRAAAKLLTRDGASPPTSPSCRSYCANRRRRTLTQINATLPPSERQVRAPTRHRFKKTPVAAAVGAEGRLAPTRHRFKKTPVAAAVGAEGRFTPPWLDTLWSGFERPTLICSTSTGCSCNSASNCLAGP